MYITCCKNQKENEGGVEELFEKATTDTCMVDYYLTIQGYDDASIDCRTYGWQSGFGLKRCAQKEDFANRKSAAKIVLDYYASEMRRSCQ